MPETRRYHDPCGIARALDLIGDRWALLVVRELLFGPKRFLQIRSGLRSVSPNVLAQRLRELEQAGVVRRDVLDPPASVAVYELTKRGRALEPVLLALGRWGSQEAIPAGELSTSALLVAMKALFDPAAAADATFALDVDGEWFLVTVSGGAIDITRGRSAGAAVILHADVTTLRSVAFGRELVADAERDGRLIMEGDRGLAERFALMFPADARAEAGEAGAGAGGAGLTPGRWSGGRGGRAVAP